MLDGVRPFKRWEQHEQRHGGRNVYVRKSLVGTEFTTINKSNTPH